MAKKPTSAREHIRALLAEKALVKLEVMRNTDLVFGLVRDAARAIANDMNPELARTDPRIAIHLGDKGPKDLEVRFSDDVLIFSMHTDVFSLDDSHPARKLSYLSEDGNRGFCGMIMVYNFLTDSFQYNRSSDIGYLIARIFVNREGHFFVEGKRQLGFLYTDFGSQTASAETIRLVIESAILYSVSFDLFVPPFDQMKLITVQEVKDKTMSGLIATGKRLGFKFNADTDQPE